MLKKNKHHLLFNYYLTLKNVLKHHVSFLQHELANPFFRFSCTLTMCLHSFSSLKPLFFTGVHGDSLTVLQAPGFVSFQKGDWPVSGEKIPDLVALTMGFSIQEVRKADIFLSVFV